MEPTSNRTVLRRAAVVALALTALILALLFTVSRRGPNDLSSDSVTPPHARGTDRPSDDSERTAPPTHTGRVERARVEAPAPSPEDAEDEPVRLTVTVRDADGRPAVGANVRVAYVSRFGFGEEAARWFHASETDEDGQTSLRSRQAYMVVHAWKGEDTGAWELFPRDLTTASAVIDLRAGVRVRVSVDSDVSQADVSGTVVEFRITPDLVPFGKSIREPGARLAGRRRVPEGFMNVVGTTDDDGVCLSPPLPTGPAGRDVWVIARQDGYVAWADKIHAAAGVTTNVAVRLRSALRLVGRVVDSEGNPPGELLVTQGGLTHEAWLRDGAFEVEDVYRTEGEALFTAPGVGSRLVSWSGAGAFFNEDVDLGTIVLEPIDRVRGVVVLQNGSPASGATVLGQRANGTWFQRFSDEDGSFDIEGIGSGSVTLTAQSGFDHEDRETGVTWSSWRSADVETAAGDHSVRLVLRPLPTLVLARLVDGLPHHTWPERFRVLVRAADGSQESFGRRRADGPQEFPLAGSAPWTVTVDAGSVGSAEIEVTKAHPQVERSVELVE